MIVIEDTTIQRANYFVTRWHRHSNIVPAVQSRFAYEMVEILPALKFRHTVGVAIVGNPCGRPNDPRIIELRRVAFKPKQDFGHYRRYYPKKSEQHSISLRKIPVLINMQNFKSGIVVNAHEIPSTFVGVASKIVKQRLPKMHTIWTYIHSTEKGRYLEKAGYYCNYFFKRRGVEKKRYELTI